MNYLELNVDENEDIAKQYGIDGLPTLLVFKDGKTIGYLEGYVEKKDLKLALGKARQGTRVRGENKEKLGPSNAYPRKNE